MTDVQFSVVALLTDTAELVERVRYDAYGRARHRWFSDLDGDGDADGDDFFAQLAAQSTSIHADAAYRPDADHDRNGVIDNSDFFAFLSGAGQAALPFGLISDPLGPDNPIGYDGYIFAPEAGLNVPAGDPQPHAVGAYVVRFRWYLPETGRWLQRDPAGYVDGVSLYEITTSNPIMGIDPMGLCDIIWKGRWTRAEKNRFLIAASLAAGRARMLLEEVQTMRGTLTPCELSHLAAELDELETRLKEMVRQYDSGRARWIVRQGDLGPDIEAYSEYPIRFISWLFTGGEILLFKPGHTTVNAGSRIDWRTFSESALAQLLFHEMVHLAEGPFRPDYDNTGHLYDAHILDDLYSGGSLANGISDQLRNRVP